MRLHLDADALEDIYDAFSYASLLLDRYRDHHGHEARLTAFRTLEELRERIIAGNTEIPYGVLDANALGDTAHSRPLFCLFQALQWLCDWAQTPSGSRLNRTLMQFDLNRPHLLFVECNASPEAQRSAMRVDYFNSNYDGYVVRFRRTNRLRIEKAGTITHERVHGVVQHPQTLRWVIESELYELS